jgi:hypothetical protein
MNGATFDSVMRHAATGITRRASLLTLGGAAVAAAPVLEAAAARKNRKKRKRNTALCKRLRAQCRRVIEDVCAGAAFPETCRAEFLPGCDPLARCNAEEAFRQTFVLC